MNNMSSVNQDPIQNWIVKQHFFCFHGEYTNAHNTMVTTQQYIARRKALLDKVPDSSILVIFGAKRQHKSADQHFPFWQLGMLKSCGVKIQILNQFQAFHTRICTLSFHQHNNTPSDVKADIAMFSLYFFTIACSLFAT